METKYLNFTTEELVIDKQFISWTNMGENSLMWSSFVIRNPEMKAKIETAKYIVKLVQNNIVIMPLQKKEPLLNEIKKMDKTLRSKRKRVSWISQNIAQGTVFD